MAQGQSTKVISMIKRIRTGRLSTKKSLSLLGLYLGHYLDDYLDDFIGHT